MREETRKKLERQLWLNRLKWLGAGLLILLGVGAGFWWTGLDASVQTRHLAGVIEKVGPLSGASSIATETALAVDVKLDDGRLAHVIALKTTHPEIGARVEIAEHVHGTGRITFTWK